MTQPKQLTYRETIEQELRALRRLHDKRLCYGSPYIDFGCGNRACCAIGALRAHSSTLRPIEPTELRGAVFFPMWKRRFRHDSSAGEHILNANDGFRSGNNSIEAQRARYAYMVQWCLDKLAEPQSVSA